MRFMWSGRVKVGFGTAWHGMDMNKNEICMVRSGQVW